MQKTIYMRNSGKENLKTLRRWEVTRNTTNKQLTRKNVKFIKFLCAYKSERQDLNLRPLQPHCSALPDYATLRFIF